MRRFTSEAEMVDLICSKIVDLLGHGSYRVFTECPAFPGVADVVIAEFDETAIDYRARHGVGPVLDHLMARVLQALRLYGPLSLDDLAAKLGVSSGYLRRTALATLLREGQIARTKTRVYFPVIDYRPVVRRIVAVEAKLKDWTQGFYQARRYQRFANLVLLVVDAGYVHRVMPYVNDLRNTGIGLVAANAANGALDMILSPRGSQPLSMLDYAVIAERLWSASLQARHPYFLGRR